MPNGTSRSAASCSSRNTDSHCFRSREPSHENDFRLNSREWKRDNTVMAAGAEPHLERHTCVNLVPLAAPRNDGPGPDNLSLHSAASRHPSTPSMPAEE